MTFSKNTFPWIIFALRLSEMHFKTLHEITTQKKINNNYCYKPIVIRCY